MPTPKNSPDRTSGHAELIAKALSCKRLAISAPTFYRYIKAGLCTKQVKVGPGNASRWPSHEIDAIVAARMAGASDDQVRSLVARLHDLRQQQYAAVLAQVAA